MIKRQEVDNDIFEEYNYQNNFHYTNENKEFLSSQLITYIGNKRRLLSLIDKGIYYCQKRINKKKLSILDGFSGSGVVSRNLKRFSSILYSNDLESYSFVVNKCYLSNKSEIDIEFIKETIFSLNYKKLHKKFKKGIIEKLYSPKNDNNIKKDERVFYTNKNARIIDNIRRMIRKIDKQEFFLAPLLSEASIHANTSGLFKGFYKNKETGIGQFGGTAENCLNRIKREIVLPVPVFSNYECEVNIYQKNINNLISELPEIDVAYYDPPYNQHPYGSNYFMLNLIVGYKEPKEMSKISGIPKEWNKSDYNNKKAELSLNCLIRDTKAKFILLSYNNEGIIFHNKIVDILEKYGKIEILEQDYNTFRGSRNLRNRNKKVKEFLFILEKC